MRTFGKFLGYAAALLLVLIGTLIAFRLPLGPSLSVLIEGAAGDRFAVARTLLKTTPLLFTGLGIVIAWRAKAYNIGGEGQFIVGGLAGAAAWHFLLEPSHFPAFIATSSMLIASVVGGAGWAFIAGWLHIRRGVEPVIGTILLNFVALQLLSWAVQWPLQQAAHRLPQTDSLPDAVMLYRPDRQTDLHVGSLLAIAAMIALQVFLFHTKAGYEIRFTGSNPLAARANRIDGSRAVLRAFLISGGLCGLAGGVEFVGTAGLLDTGFSQNWGFLGIPVALLAGLNPAAVLVSALYFGALLAGSENLGRFTQGGPTLVYVVQGAAVLVFVGIGSARLDLKNLGRRLAWTR